MLLAGPLSIAERAARFGPLGPAPGFRELHARGTPRIGAALRTVVSSGGWASGERAVVGAAWKIQAA